MWKIVKCEVQGKSHIKNNVPCQDKTFSVSRNGVNIIALADGAGSAKLSHFGAKCVTEFVCNEFADNFDRFYNYDDGVTVKKELISKILLSLDKVAKQQNDDIKEFASTLMFVAVKDDKFIISHIGDGVIGYLNKGELKIASEPDNGEFINTTVFTTSKTAILSMKLLKGNLGNINGFVLMSDGTEAALYNKREKRLSNGIKKIMNLCSYISVLKIEDMLIKSFDYIVNHITTDDCSICIMVNDNLDFDGYNNLNKNNKIKLLHLNNKTITKKQIKRYDKLLNCLAEEKSLKNISRYIHVKPKYAKKYLNKLVELNFVEKTGSNYHTVLLLNTKADK